MKKTYTLSALLLVYVLQLTAQTDSLPGKKKFSITEVGKKHYVAVDEIGGLFGLGGVARGKNFFSYHSVNAWQFDPHAYAGPGFGIEVSGKNGLLLTEPNSNIALMIPLFMEIRAALTSTRIAPFISQKAGYSFFLAMPKPASQVIGGGMMQSQLGIKGYISNKASFNISVGYRLQTLAIPPAYNGQLNDINLPPAAQAGDIKTLQYYHFATVHVGFTY